jgi:hypothetical protein
VCVCVCWCVCSVWEFVVEGVENLPAEVVVEVVYSGVLVMGCGVRLSKSSLPCCSVDG